MAFTLHVVNPGTEQINVPIAAAAAGSTAEDAMKTIEAHDGGVNSQTFAEPKSAATVDCVGENALDCVGENASVAESGERRS